MYLSFNEFIVFTKSSNFDSNICEYVFNVSSILECPRYFATTAYGSLSDNYGNGCILYVNVDTVEVKQIEDEVLIGSPKGSQRERK